VRHGHDTLRIDLDYTVTHSDAATFGYAAAQ
jgi:hypothetical protein